MPRGGKRLSSAVVAGGSCKGAKTRLTPNGIVVGVIRDGMGRGGFHGVVSFLFFLVLGFGFGLFIRNCFSFGWGEGGCTGWDGSGLGFFL